MSGLVGIVSIGTGVIGVLNGAFGGFMGIATGIVFIGIFFALARILNIDSSDK